MFCLKTSWYSLGLLFEYAGFASFIPLCGAETVAGVSSGGFSRLVIIKVLYFNYFMLLLDIVSKTLLDWL
jgi:hypothetical protein